MDWLIAIFEKLTKGKLTEGTKADEMAAEMVSEVKKELGKYFIPKEEFNAKNDELKAAKAKLDELNKTVGDLSKSGEDVAKIQADLEKTRGELETFKLETDKREANRKKVAVIEKNLREAKASEDAIDLLTGQFNLDEVKLDAKGNVVDWDEHFKPIKEARKTLFGTVTRSTGEPANPATAGIKPTKKALIDQYNEAEKRKDVAAMISLQTQIKNIKESE